MASSFKDLMSGYTDDTNVSSLRRDEITKQYSELVNEKVESSGLDKYPHLSQYTKPVKKAERQIIGREEEMDRLLAAMMRPELCNVILLGEAGAGKTALVQGTMMIDKGRLYLEVDLSRMIADTADARQLGDKLKQLFEETQRFREENKTEIVLFMDEFHQIVQLSSAAVEALKPLLADSGTRGIRVIAATTFIEFRDFIQPNQPLVERLQRINLDAPDKKTTVKILKGMVKRYGVDNQFVDDRLLEMIYDLTNRYIPANSQPRKSILVLDSMVGWYRFKKRRMNLRLLADVIYESEGINIAFRVDASKIKEELDSRVFAQEFATSIIEERLQVCVADLNDKTKPMSSFLFTGSTGVGKMVSDNEMVPVYAENGTAWKRHGDLVVGDYVFNRWGKPVEVIGVFPQGVKDVYEVELTDGRTLRVGDGHLWTYKSRFGNGSKHWKVCDTKTLMEKYQNKYFNDGRSAHNIKFVIPMNHAVEWDEKTYKTDPYVIGVAIGNGCLRDKAFTVSSGDVDTVLLCKELIGAFDLYKDPTSYSYSFYTHQEYGVTHTRYRTSDILSEVPELIGTKSGEKFIPEIYKYGSVEQRWSLIQGMFDTDGTISNDDRCNVSYSTTSKRLAYDLQDVLYSLGISSSVNVHEREGKSSEYDVHVKCNATDKLKFFRLQRKLDIANKAVALVSSKVRVKKFGDVIGIRDVRKLNEKESMSCIMVNDEDHLYQAGQYIVTHNTEICKQLARVLFQDERRLIRFDMSEFANPDSLDSFRRELTNKVWERPYSIILLDEIEKACAPVTRLLLQVLDDGRLMDENNREVTFTNAYIVLTTNAGSEVYKDIAQYDASDTGDGRHMFKYEKLIRESISSTTGDNKFPPELLGRIDCIVPFQPLSENTQMMIISTKLQQLISDVRDKHGVELQIKKEVINYICRDKLTTDSDEGGARAAIARMQSEVYTAVARHINQYPEQKSIVVDVDGDMAWANKNMLESNASIKIYNVVQSVR